MTVGCAVFVRFGADIRNQSTLNELIAIFPVGFGNVPIISLISAPVKPFSRICSIQLSYKNSRPWFPEVSYSAGIIRRLLPFRWLLLSKKVYVNSLLAQEERDVQAP